MLNIRQVHRTANQHAGALFLIGCASVAAYNWRLWQRDRALAKKLRDNQLPVPRLARHPKVSALVAAWNEAAHIDAHIQSFLALDYPSIELVLCAGGSDDTLARARRYAGPRVIVIEQRAGEGKQKALARCYEHASGEIIYLTDADCLFGDEALTRLLAPMQEECAQVVTGSSRPLDRQLGQLLPSYIWSTDVVVNAHTGAYVNGLLGRNAAIARATLCQIGGLDFVAHTGTDYQLAQRLRAAGFSIRFICDSVVQSEYPSTLGEYRRRQSRWLRNVILYGPRYRALHDVAATLRTMAIGAAMLLLPLLALPGGMVVLAIWGVVFGHATAKKLRYALFTACLHRQTLSKQRIIASVPLAALDFGIWALPAFDMLHAKRRKQW